MECPNILQTGYIRLTNQLKSKTGKKNLLKNILIYFKHEKQDKKIQVFKSILSRLKKK
jgi:chemotaxis methyl-accepting protein methylase